MSYTLGQGARCGEMLRPRRVLFVLFTSCLLFQPKATAEVKEVRRAVVFYELGLSSPAMALADREMLATLEESRYKIELYREHLETTLFDDQAAQQAFREWYVLKYRDRRPDLIIAGANANMFDWRALRRWGFRVRDLPPGSAVLFHCSIRRPCGSAPNGCG